MSNVYKQAEATIRTAVDAAMTEHGDAQPMLKALMREILKFYAGERSPQDILSELEFELENIRDDGEFHFMRP